MFFQSHARFFVIAVLTMTGVSSVSADDSGRLSDRIFNFVDKNKDGNIDAGEFRTMPATMQTWLIARKIQPNPTLSKTDFQREFPHMMTDLRKARPTPSTLGGGNGGADTEPVKPPLYATTPPDTGDEVEITPIANGLPSEYQEADLDRSGQIDFFEWRKSGRPKSEFEQRDVNGDSVLSVAELNGSAPVASSGSSSTGGSSTGPGPARTTPAVDLTGVEYDKLPANEKTEYVKILKTYFTYLDTAEGTGNKDGKLQEKEWDASSRIKPIFVNAKIDIKKDMTEADFISHYTKLVGTKDPTWLERVKKLKESSRDNRTSSRFGNGGGFGAKTGGFGAKTGGFGAKTGGFGARPVGFGKQPTQNGSRNNRSSRKRGR